MNIRDLKYLVAVAEHRHFSKAAETCFVSQPALSMQIKKLEETLDVQLIERNNKNILLTETGKAITQQAREILHRVNNMKDIAKNAQDPFSGTLTMGIIPTLAPYLLPHIFSKLSEKFPKLAIYLVEDITVNLTEKLSQGNIDCALLAIPLHENIFTTLPLFDEPFYLATSISHTLSQHKYIHLSDLEKHSVLLLDEGHCLREQTLQVCHQAKTFEFNSFRATSLETLRYMVASNIGITLMPKLACLPHNQICYIPFEPPEPKRTIGLVSRSSTSKMVVLEAIANEIKFIINKTY